MAKRKKTKPTRVSRSQQSPYDVGTEFKMEIKMNVEKIEPEKCPQENEPGQGCGVPGCPVCMPSSGRSGIIFGIDRGRDRSSFAFEERMHNAMQETIAQAFRLSPSMLFGIDRASEKVQDNPEVVNRRRLEDAERMARKPIEKYLLKDELQVDWADIAGNEEAHAAMVEAIEFPIKRADLFKFYGKKMTKGILLSGAPGCGKTMFGKAAAKVIGNLHGKAAALLVVNATELQQPYVGQTEQIIRDLFAYAKAYKALHGYQLVLFIDEADAILPCRNGGMGRRVAGWEESNVATFLSEMDGIEESGALVILATNRPQAIDPALLRDGRIDRKIVVRRPDQKAAHHILYRALDNVPLAPLPVMITEKPFLGAHDYLADRAIEDLFSPLRHILRVKHEGGTDYLTLADCVSGAMVVGIVERAKKAAMERDTRHNTMTGITEHDMTVAIDAVMKEQIDLPDVYALTELAQRLKTPVLELDRVQQPELKYTGTLQ